MNKQALKNFSDIMDDNTNKMQFIQSLLHDYEAQSKNEKINWCHVGDVGHLNEALEEIENQLVELVNPPE